MCDLSPGHAVAWHAVAAIRTTHRMKIKANREATFFAVFLRRRIFNEVLQALEVGKEVG